LKAVIYDLDGNLVASGSRPTEQFHPSPDHPEWTVWQPEQIWQGTAAAIRDAVAAIDDARKIRGLAVTGMGMDGLPVDDQGRWLYPMISWHDPRTAPQLAWWREHVGVEKTFSIGGNPVWAINTALHAAETGHMVFSTLHTLDAVETINRIIAILPPPEQKQIRLQLAAVLRAVVSQRLVKRCDGEGRVPAVEVLMSTPRVVELIADPTRAEGSLEQAIAEGEYYGTPLPNWRQARASSRTANSAATR
jgi:hypothetical protein